MDDWTASATAAAVPPTRAPYRPQSVTLTQARFFMDDIYRSITPHGLTAFAYARCSRL